MQNRDERSTAGDGGGDTNGWPRQPILMVWCASCAAVMLAGAVTATAGWHVRSPSLSEYRPWPLVGALASGLLLCVAAVWLWNLAGRQLHAATRLASVPMVAAAGAALAVPMTVEAAFQWDRLTVWRAGPERIAALGRHLIVGFSDWDEITARVEQRAVGGIFIRRQTSPDLKLTTSPRG